MCFYEFLKVFGYFLEIKCDDAGIINYYLFIYYLLYNNNNNNCNICQPPYSLISIKETKLEDILQVLSKAALN